MLEIFLLGSCTTEVAGSFIFGSLILRANRGTPFEKIQTPLRQIARHPWWLIPKEKRNLQFYPTHPIWSLSMPRKVYFPQGGPVAATSSHFSLAEPQEVFLCCVARMLLTPLCKQTGQVSANLTRCFALHLHRAVFFLTGNQQRNQPLLWLRIRILGHPIDMAV